MVIDVGLMLGMMFASLWGCWYYWTRCDKLVRNPIPIWGGTADGWERLVKVFPAFGGAYALVMLEVVVIIVLRETALRDVGTLLRDTLLPVTMVAKVGLVVSVAYFDRPRRLVPPAIRGDR